jgi:hypothetical protein
MKGVDVLFHVAAVYAYAQTTVRESELLDASIGVYAQAKAAL